MKIVMLAFITVILYGGVSCKRGNPVVNATVNGVKVCQNVTFPYSIEEITDFDISNALALQDFIKTDIPVRGVDEHQI